MEERKIKKPMDPTPTPPVPPTEDKIVVPREAAEQRLLAYIDEQIAKMQQYSLLGSGKEPTFYEVNRALCAYQDANLSLISLYNIAKLDLNKVKDEFESWYAEKYIDTRQRVNPVSLAATKWYSQKEIDMMIRFENKDKFHQLDQAVVLEEQRVAFLRRLLDNWAQYAYILTQLSKNLVSELSGLNVENALDKALNKGTQTN